MTLSAMELFFPACAVELLAEKYDTIKEKTHTCKERQRQKQSCHQI